MRNKIYAILTVALIVLTFILGFKKYNSWTKEKKNLSLITVKHDSIQKIWIEKPLMFPDSIYDLKSKEKISEHFLKNELKTNMIVSYFDADCSDCVFELEKWKAFFNKYPEVLKRCSIVFITTSTNLELLKYQIYDEAKFPYLIFFDEKNDFFNINRLSEIKAYQTFLLKNGKIIYLGSPVRNSFFKKKFLNTIEELKP